MSKLRSRFKRPARSAPRVEAGKRILVVCEGAVTETQYINGLVRHCESSLVAVEVIGPSGVPLTVVAKAKALHKEAERASRQAKDSTLNYDEVWCVFDVDDHPGVPAARETAMANGLNLAMSNPCFELWLLLHLRDAPGPVTRKKVQSMLKEHMPNVPEKHVDLDRVLPEYEAAIVRAQRLQVDGETVDDRCRNPSTEVHHLVNSIDESGRVRRTKQLRQRDDLSLAKASAAAAAALAQALSDSSESE